MISSFVSYPLDRTPLNSRFRPEDSTDATSRAKTRIVCGEFSIQKRASRPFQPTAVLSYILAANSLTPFPTACCLRIDLQFFEQLHALRAALIVLSELRAVSLHPNALPDVSENLIDPAERLQPQQGQGHGHQLPALRGRHHRREVHPGAER